MSETKPDIVEGKVVPTFFKFVLPNALSLAAISSSGVVDAAFVGHFAEPSGLAAINIANPFFSFVFGICIMLITGGVVRAGKYLGEGKAEDAGGIFARSITAVAIFTFILSVFSLIFPETVVRLLGANAELAPISAKYLTVIVPFLVLGNVGYAFSAFVRVDGRPFLSFAGLLSGAAINVLLDFVMVVWLGLGVKGAALATGISYSCVFIILSTHFLFKKGALRFTLKSGKWSELIKSGYNGFSEFVSEMSIGLVVMLFNKIMISKMGAAGVSAFTAINYLMWVGGMVNYATGDSLNPLVSVNYGAGLFGRIKSFLKLALAFVFTNGFVIFCLLTFIPEVLIGIFLPDKSSEAFAIALEFAYYMRWAFFISGLNIVFSAYFTALHRPLESALVSSLRGLLLPVLFLSLLPRLFGNAGIYVALPLGDFLTLGAALLLYRINSRRLKKETAGR